MPVSPPPDRILREFLAVHRAAENRIIEAIARATARGLSTDDLNQQAVEARRLRVATEGIVRQLMRAVATASPRMLMDAVLYGGRTAVADLDAALGGPGRDYDSPLNQGALDSIARSLSDTLAPAHLSVTRTVDDVYKRVMGRASVGVLVGTETRRRASQRALDEFAAAGVTGFTDKAGRRWRLDTYAEMAARTATARAAVDAHVDRLAAEDLDLVYVSDSPQECPLCRPFEGRVLTTTGFGGPAKVSVEHALYDDVLVEIEHAGSLTYARGLGLFHPNCTHSVSLWLPGVTELPKNTENPDGYEAKQTLRYLEVGVRKAKRLRAAAMTPEARAKANRRVRRWTERIEEHVDRTGAKRQRAREQNMEGRASRAETPTQDRGYVAAERVPDPQPLELTAPPRRAAIDAPAPEPAPAAPKSLRKVRDADLDQRMQDALLAEDLDEFDRITEEIERRDIAKAAAQERRIEEREAKERAQAEEMERQLAAGADEESAVEAAYGISVDKQRRQAAIAELRRDGYSGGGFDQMARDSFHDQVWRNFDAAEEATNGYMLTREAVAAGVDPKSLFVGPAGRVTKHASPELKEWFDQNGRLTLDEWKAELLGDGAGARNMRSARGDFYT